MSDIICYLHSSVLVQTMHEFICRDVLGQEDTSWMTRELHRIPFEFTRYFCWMTTWDQDLIAIKNQQNNVIVGVFLSLILISEITKAWRIEEPGGLLSLSWSLHPNWEENVIANYCKLLARESLSERWKF